MVKVGVALIIGLCGQGWWRLKVVLAGGAPLWTSSETPPLGLRRPFVVRAEGAPMWFRQKAPVALQYAGGALMCTRLDRGALTIPEAPPPGRNSTQATMGNEPDTRGLSSAGGT